MNHVAAPSCKKDWGIEYLAKENGRGVSRTGLHHAWLSTKANTLRMIVGKTERAWVLDDILELKMKPHLELAQPLDFQSWEIFFSHYLSQDLLLLAVESTRSLRRKKKNTCKSSHGFAEYLGPAGFHLFSVKSHHPFSQIPQRHRLSEWCEAHTPQTTIKKK